MAFTGKATYSAGGQLPELAEDLSDLIQIVSPYETPLLDAIGDSMREATSTHHEWLEDVLLPNKDVFTNLDGQVAENWFGVENPNSFRKGDQIQPEDSEELMLVTDISDRAIGVVRCYAGTKPGIIAIGQVVAILGNAGLEGGDNPTKRFTKRKRRSNFMHKFTAKVEVCNNDLQASQLGLADEMDYQKQERVREMLRSLEASIINGELSDEKRRMKGIWQILDTNIFRAGGNSFPPGNVLNEDKVNHVLKHLWENSSGNVDLIIVGGYQKRVMNKFLIAKARADDAEANLYHSDYGICKIITCRWVPQDAVLFLDSSRINVLPLAGNSFYFKPIAKSGDYEAGEVMGVYTLELKNEEMHAVIRDLAKGE